MIMGSMPLLLKPSFNKVNEFVQFLYYKEVWCTHELQHWVSKREAEHKIACIKQTDTKTQTTDKHHATLVLYDTKQKWVSIKN